MDQVRGWRDGFVVFVLAYHAGLSTLTMERKAFWTRCHAVPFATNSHSAIVALMALSVLSFIGYADHES